jgi:hypothetical protein
MGRITDEFVKEEAKWPRSQLFGLLISVLNDFEKARADSADLNAFAETLEWETKVLPVLQGCVEVQKKPLYGDVDPDRYIAKLDLKGGDIDGIGKM